MSFYEPFNNRRRFRREAITLAICTVVFLALLWRMQDWIAGPVQ